MSTPKEMHIEAILSSGAKYVQTTISNEACAVAIAIKDIEDAESFPADFEWNECAIGLDVDDY